MNWWMHLSSGYREKGLCFTTKMLSYDILTLGLLMRVTASAN